MALQKYVSAVLCKVSNNMVMKYCHKQKSFFFFKSHFQFLLKKKKKFYLKNIPKVNIVIMQNDMLY